MSRSLACCVAFLLALASCSREWDSFSELADAFATDDATLAASQKNVQTHTRGLAELFFALHDAAFGPAVGTVAHVQSWPDGTSIEIEIEIKPAAGSATMRAIEIRDVSSEGDTKVSGEINLDRLPDGTIRASGVRIVVDNLEFRADELFFDPAARPILAANGTLTVDGRWLEIVGLFATIDLHGDGTGSLSGTYYETLGSEPVDYPISLG